MWKPKAPHIEDDGYVCCSEEVKAARSNSSSQVRETIILTQSRDLELNGQWESFEQEML
jgi:hypothetical protein